MQHTGLITDLYQLTMMQGYFTAGAADRRAVFELFFRRPPFGGEFAITCGLEPALEFLEGVRFDRGSIDYLRGLDLFEEPFLAALGGFGFTGDVLGIAEGTPVFAGEPLLRVEAPLWQAQLVESALLNTLNFQTLIATKAARICQAAGPASVLEFGLRRAQGFDGAFSASRAALIGGCSGTSNVEAARRLGAAVRGTQAHSWVMSFPGEIDAFRAYARAFPDSTVLLVDTYDTLSSGVPNAIEVAREMRRRGHRLLGIRLDSGDLAELSRAARRRLDEAGFPDVAIVVSSDLDEHSISDLRARGAPIDVFGVGTRLVVGAGEAALGGVYKLVAVEVAAGTWRLTRKRSDSREKALLPGIKQVWRRFDASGTASGDLIAVGGESIGMAGGRASRALLEPVMREGRRTSPSRSVEELRDRTLAGLESLPAGCRKLTGASSYPVELSADIKQLLEAAPSPRQSGGHRR